MKRLLLYVCFLFCNEATSQPLFELLPASQSGLDFTNSLVESDSLHIFLYEYLYNGNGIGVGDFNGDGRPDLFVSGNTVPNKLFLNTSSDGKITFQDVTRKAKVSGEGRWATGVSVADINGDGLLDIYVCHSGYYNKLSDRNNLLYLNQGNKKGVPVFKEVAKELGLHATGSQSTQAVFFDYDRDGDLDMFLLNHSNHTVNPFLNTKEMRSIPNPYFGNRLFRNRSEEGKLAFEDVTIQAGIVNNALNFGLSVIVSDINQDGWPDLYATSDYTEVDSYYINNRDGTFTESLEKSFTHVSKFSMGADVGDFNNDGLPDVLTLDMLPEDNRRQKLLKGPDMYDQYHLLLDSGYYHQNMRNMLHLNRGKDRNGNIRFSEIGQLAGISNTDWSWAGLMADLDNDGWKDLLFTNGYLRDFTNMDFLKYTVADEQLKAIAKGETNFKTYDLVKKMPSNKLRNYLFRNVMAEERAYSFEDVSERWGLTSQNVSNAAVYADFDQDGDLDVVISNINEPLSLYRNNSTNKGFRLKLIGKGKNSQALGSKVWVYTNNKIQYAELSPVRGYQSTVTSELHFGLGTIGVIDSIKVVWPSQLVTTIKQVEQSSLELSEDSAKKEADYLEPANFLVSEIDPTSISVDFIHQENDFIDFKVEVLLPYQLSKFGPALAVGDVNGDGREDMFFGGAINQFGVLYLQEVNGSFMAEKSQPWRSHAACDEVAATFVDVDQDGDLDLYVVSGGNEYEDQSPQYRDHLYINRGAGLWEEAVLALPSMKNPKQCISYADIDGDGDLDLFVGGRAVPGSFPKAARSYLLRNDTQQGNVKFTDVTHQWSAALLEPGMLTGAYLGDLNDDGKVDLMLVGDWMKVRVFQNTGESFKELIIPALSNSEGLWATLVPIDIDKDGDLDFVLGNLGRNNQFKSSSERPMVLYYEDFDGDGFIDPILAYHFGEKRYPMFSRDEMLDQMPSLKRKYTTYESYADQTLESIFGEKAVDESKKLYCRTLNSVILENKGNFNYEIHDLPEEVQFSRVSAAMELQSLGNNISDLVLAGNFDPLRVQMGPCNASVGLILRQTHPFQFKVLPPGQTGFWASGDIRNMSKVGKHIVLTRNDHQPLIFEIHE
ncbi:VCBS repeat-containing protein [Dyadobacter tibetensis]|uniref:VCBS repeat-containing protein n=1 Tax=Dyadobacter tibetensis TaxID=1211851 RepID=UPI0004706029|nr:VCBS repeat-containing protein [Dyadobacter tibetensis]